MASVTFPTNLGGSGATISDDADPNTGLANSGHRTRFIPALSGAVDMAATSVAKAQEAEDFKNICQQLRDDTETFKNQASTYENNAANSATLSEEWATKLFTPVDGSEYSSKYYANEASESAAEAAQSAASVDANTIVHTPGSGLPNEAGTAASRDVTTSATDTDGNRVVRLTDGDERYGRQLSSNEWSGTNSFHKPLDFWGDDIDFYGVASGANVCGSLATQGSYAVCLTSNGYRSSSDSSWVSYGVDGETGAAEVRCLPSGYVIISAETNKPTGSNSSLTPSLVVTSSSLTFNGNDVYSQPNILGTVSQSGGVPTGAIIERGSNANGEYVKFADGTLICTQTFSATGIVNAQGQIFESDNIVWTFPVPFITTPVSSGLGTGGNNRVWVVLGDSGSSKSTTSMRVCRAVSVANSLTFNMQATGRWT